MTEASSPRHPSPAANGEHTHSADDATLAATSTTSPPTDPASTPSPNDTSASAPPSTSASAPASPSSAAPPSAPPSTEHPPPAPSAEDGVEEPASKRQRKRKSLWDQPSPAGTPSTSAIPTLQPTPPAVPSPLFTQLQSQLALLPHLSHTPPSLSSSSSPFPFGHPHHPPLSSSHALSSPTTASRLDRRIYVGSLAYDIPEDTLRVIFEPFGPVAKVDMPKEPGHFPPRSKGFAFVEFERVDSAKAALMTMNGIQLRGRPMKVGKPTGGAGSEYGSFLSQLMMGGGGGLGALAGQQLNATAMAAIQAAQIASGGTFNLAALLTPTPSFTLPQGVGGGGGGGVGGVGGVGADRIPGSVGGSTAKTRIYVGSLMWELTEEQVRAIFEPFGAIKSVQLILNPDTGKHRGYGFVEYFDEKSAADAIAAMDGFDLIGRKLKVNYASALVAPQGAHQNAASHGGGGGGGGGGGPLPPVLPPGFTIPTLPASLLPSPPPFTLPTTTPSAPLASLSSEDNLRIHSHEQRASIMQKLHDSGRQSPVVLLKNLVAASEVDAELEGEVAEECGKYGRVRQVKVVPEHATGVVRVYVQFESVAESGRAVEGLNGRFFDKRQVSAEFYPELRYQSQLYTDAT